MIEQLFLSVDSNCLAREISLAKQTVCYAAPGILEKPAEALARLARRVGPEMISVCLDFDEHVMRMGFGTLDAVEKLRNVGIEVRSIPGLRTGLIVIDDGGYIFTPIALYLETDNRSESAPNAMRLSEDQVKVALARLSPSAKIIAGMMAKSDREREWIREQTVDNPSEKVGGEDFENIRKKLEEAPPVNFDVARQVRVYNAYIQYVELNLSGAAIQRHRLTIPQSIQKLGGAEELTDRLKTTFDLIEKDGKLSSRALENSLNDIRKNFTPSLGKDHGRIILKQAKPHFEQKIEILRGQLKDHQKTVKHKLQRKLDKSRKQVVSYYVPQVVENPPDAMRGQFPKIGKKEAKAWLNSELERVFPKARDLVKKMQLDVSYKDVTFGTLNEKSFLEAIREAFPHIDWDKAYSDYRAAGESKDGENSGQS